MLPGSAAKTNFGIVIGMLAGWIIWYEPLGTLLPYITWAIAFVGLLFHGWGCYNYVTGKGHAAPLALVGLVPLAIFLSGVVPGFQAPSWSLPLVPLGLILLALLPDHRKTPNSDTPDTSAKRLLSLRENLRLGQLPLPPQKSPWTAPIVGILVIATIAIALLAAMNETVRHAFAPRTVAETQSLAVKRYPALGVEGSPLHREFVSRYRHYQATNPAYFNDRNWPLSLAAESQAAVNQGSPSR